VTGHAHHPIRVVLVEDHDLAREALTALLNAQPDIDVVSDVATVAEAVDQITTLAPRVAVIDAQLTDGSGIALCQRIQAISPHTRCIIHTSIQIDPEPATEAGADAIVLKQVTNSQLLDAIRDTNPH
jgi:DNA-binding NarL/FixJ family response regulator